MSKSEAESVGEIENDGVEVDVDILTGDDVQRSQYTLLKTWVTGDKAITEEEDIKMEIFDLARPVYCSRCQGRSKAKMTLPCGNVSVHTNLRAVLIPSVFSLPNVLFMQMQCRSPDNYLADVHLFV